MENGDKIQFVKDIASLQTDMGYIKKQVDNHLPTQIKDMARENKEEHEQLRNAINGIKNKLATWSGGIAVFIVVAQLVISKFF